MRFDKKEKSRTHSKRTAENEVTVMAYPILTPYDFGAIGDGECRYAPLEEE